MPSLDIGLPVTEIVPKLHGVLREVHPDGNTAAAVHEVTAVNRRGKTVELQIVASPLRTEEGTISGIIMVIDQKAP